jgi:hypothetical protein
MTETNVFTRAWDSSRVCSHVIDGRLVFLGECFDDLLVTGRIAGVVPQNGHWLSSRNCGRC